MNYICTKRFKALAIDGNVNIAPGTELICEDNMIKRKTKRICLATSENGHAYFMCNDDGNGLARGELIEAIKTALTDDPNKWEKIVNDPKCQSYRREGHDVWLWNHAFYNASIETLTYIKNLVVEEESNDEGK